MKRRLVLVLVPALAAVSCSSATFGMPEGATRQAEAIEDLWRIFFIAGSVVAAIVYGLIAWSIVRYRRRRHEPDDVEGAPFRSHVPIELIYTGIPVLMIIGLFAASWDTGQDVDAIANDAAVELQAEAFEWGWRFTYPDEDVTVVSPPSEQGVPGPLIAMPLGLTTHVVLTANQVQHAFWVPGFLFKRDAIPGHVNEFDVTPSRSGTYAGACAEFCGLNHAYMTFTVEVMPPEEFETWLAENRSDEEAAA